MPNMDGIQLLKYIREHHPKIGVIVITGYSESFTYTHMIKAGASDFITKPFVADELEAKLNRLVREPNLVRQLELDAVDERIDMTYINRRYFDNTIHGRRFNVLSAKAYKDPFADGRCGHRRVTMMKPVTRKETTPGDR